MQFDALCKGKNISWLCVPKIFLIMRLTTFFLLVLALQVKANGYAQEKITLSVSDVSLETVFQNIHQQSGYNFLYSDQVLANAKSISLKVRNASLAQVLKQCLKGQPFIYNIVDKTVVIKYTGKSEQSQIATPVLSPPIEISGTITDTTGKALAGVSIVVKNSHFGTTTDKNGEFKLSVANDRAVLIISYLGFVTEERRVGNNSIFNIMLKPSYTGLNQIVVVGYGTQKKINVTGAVGTISGKELTQSPASNLSNSLPGRLAGVIVNNRSGAPGDDAAQIFIRGKGSWNGSGPLIIIDGIANRGGFDRINPQDIESISVLKDASASIYGSRAANGVVLITTKKGKIGTTTFSYDGNFGFTQPTRLTKFANSWQAATYDNEVNENLYHTPLYSPDEIQKFKDGTDPNLYPYYNIYDLMLNKSAPQSRNSLSVRGGSKGVKYYFSGGYLDEGSYFKQGVDNFKSYNILSNIDAEVSKNLEISLELMGRLDRKQNASQGNSLGEPFGGSSSEEFEEMLVNPPTLPVFYTNGFPANLYGHNLVEGVRGKGGITTTGQNVLNSQLSFKWKLPFIINGLYVSGTGAFDYNNSTIKAFNNTYDYYQYDATNNSYGNENVNPSLGRSLNQSYQNTFGKTVNLRLGFTRNYGFHNIDAFVAYEQYSMNYDVMSAQRSVFLTDQLPYLFFGGTQNELNNGSAGQTAYRNTFGRIAYNYKEKYMAEITMRRDESVKFAPDKRVGYFPGISAGWRISEENFIKNNFHFIDNLKLRGSWGQSGSDAVGDFQYLATYVLGQGYAFGSQATTSPSISASSVPNPNITWEVANNSNIGLDGDFWNGLLGFEMDYFWSKRSNILAKRNGSVPSYTGLVLPDENIGKTLNQGIEILLKHHNRISRNISYDISGNFTFVKNKVLFKDEAANIPDYQKQAGHSIDSYLLYETDGIFETQADLDKTPAKYPGAQVGDIKYIDVNGDGKIDSKDKVMVNENPTPMVIYGLTLGINYKGFSVSALMQGQADAKVLVNPMTRNGNLNIPLWMYDDRWTIDNTKATMPRAFNNRSETVNELPSTFWLRNASFARLKSLELAYSISSELLKNLGISQLRIYVNGFNLFTIDKMKGDYDPEMNSSLGVYYPQTKIYNLGINLTF
jgi:TonB-dependent starch-binding outer membrane protein SusC